MYMETLPKEVFLKEDIKLRSITLDNEKLRYQNSFDKQLEINIKGENEVQKESRKKYFSKSLEKMLILKNNGLIDQDTFNMQIGKLNSYESLENEQKIDYNVALLKGIKNLFLIGKNGDIGVEADDEIDLFNKIKNNPEKRLLVEKICRENQKLIDNDINKLTTSNQENIINLYYAGQVSKSELDQLNTLNN